MNGVYFSKTVKKTKKQKDNFHKVFTNTSRIKEGMITTVNNT